MSLNLALPPASSDLYGQCLRDRRWSKYNTRQSAIMAICYDVQGNITKNRQKSYGVQAQMESPCHHGSEA